MKLTGWYRPDQKPVRVGWYERRYTGSTFMDYWDSVGFKYSKKAPYIPAQNLRWRGIAK